MESWISLTTLLSIVSITVSTIVLIITVVKINSQTKADTTNEFHLNFTLVNQLTNLSLKRLFINFNNDRSKPVTAHLSLLPSARFPSTDSTPDPVFSSTSHSILNLDQRPQPNLHHVRGVNLTREGIQVLFSGLYYIYSNVNFNPNTTRYSADFTYQTWFQYVHRQSAHSPLLSGVLLRTVHTTCANCTHNKETSYTGGVFYLQQNDIIQVCVSGQGLIDFQPELTYLGLVLLNTNNK